MTNEETIKYFKNCNDRIISTAIDENADSKFMEETIDANSMAIKSLEAWELVQDELKNDYIGLPAYDSGVCHALKVIDKHLSEVSE